MRTTVIIPNQNQNQYSNQNSIDQRALSSSSSFISWYYSEPDNTSIRPSGGGIVRNSSTETTTTRVTIAPLIQCKEFYHNNNINNINTNIT